MIRKIICGVINTLSVLVIAAAIVILCMVLFTEPGKPPNIFGFTMLRITTGSMEPTYATDTLLVVKKTDPKEIMEGDVISFYSTDEEDWEGWQQLTKELGSTRTAWFRLAKMETVTSIQQREMRIMQQIYMMRSHAI